MKLPVAELAGRTHPARIHPQSLLSRPPIGGWLAIFSKVGPVKVWPHLDTPELPLAHPLDSAEQQFCIALFPQLPHFWAATNRTQKLMQPLVSDWQLLATEFLNH